MRNSLSRCAFFLPYSISCSYLLLLAVIFETAGKRLVQ